MEKNIRWQHLVDLYKKDNGKGSGLSMVTKLKFEHIHLTSFSKMRVDLAAQVCLIRRAKIMFQLEPFLYVCVAGP